MPTLKMMFIGDNPIPGIEEMPATKNELFEKLGLWKPRTIHDEIPANAKEILVKYKVGFEKLLREAKREPKTPAILGFLKGEGTTIPTPDIEDCESYPIYEVLTTSLKEFFATRKYSAKEALVGLLLRHAKDVFMLIGDGLLEIAPDEDDEIHVPYDALTQACAVDAPRYEALVLKAVEISNCGPCRAEAARILAKSYPKHRAKALEVARATLQYIQNRKNKEERYEFSWSGGERWSDGTDRYIGWMLSTFGDEVHADIQKYVEDTKVFDVDVAAVVAKALGQKAIDIVGEGLKMSFDSDDIAPHYRRMFGMLAPLDWSKYHDKAWELARSEFRQVRETACMALAKLDAKVVLPKAKELLDAKKGHEREAGVLILSLLGNPESKKILEGLLDTEKSDDARDIIVSSFFDASEKIDRKEAARRVESADGRGKLDKPVVKWLDEKKLPKLYWNKSKDALRSGDGSLLVPSTNTTKRDPARSRGACHHRARRSCEGRGLRDEVARARHEEWRGERSAYRKLFPHDKIEVFIGTSGLGVQSYDMDSEVTLKDLFFVRPGAIVTGSYTYDEPRDEEDERLVKLADVPPIVFSEAIADLHAITKTKEDADN